MNGDASADLSAQLREIASTLGRVESELGEVKGRLYAVETQLGRAQLNQTQFQVQIAALISRIDRFEDRFGRIERKLDPAGGR